MIITSHTIQYKYSVRTKASVFGNDISGYLVAIVGCVLLVALLIWLVRKNRKPAKWQENLSKNASKTDLNDV